MISLAKERLTYLGFILTASIGCDQITKRIAEQTLQEKSYSFLFDTVRLQFIKNSGAFLGFGSDFGSSLKLGLFIVLPVVFLIGALIFVVFSKKTTAWQSMCLILIVSGGFGNLIDRTLFSGHVTDFINIGIGSWRTGIFNIADVAIMFGAFGLLAMELQKNYKKTVSPEASAFLPHR